MHVFFDNRMDENLVTGTLLVINLFLCSSIIKIIKILFDNKNLLRFKKQMELNDIFCN